METLNPVFPVTLADAVERQIYAYIVGNKMNEGDALPKEEDLAKTLKVSRNIVREALSRLRVLGLVETRKKKGMTLAQPDAFIGLERMVTTGVMSEDCRKDIFEMRIILELGMTDYIFHNKKENDIRELEDIAAKENSKKTGRLRLEELEIAFHSKLYEMSGNNVLKRLQGILRPFFKAKISGLSKKITPPSHKDICKVLKNGTVEEFRRVMHAHLSVYLIFDKQK
ncbi:MAG: hypothetical protein A2017_21465 [Lentisphaerae bacterium GWF2_44_16]|nr:MAG: hypothetical protein A2017_21465 [Lentisphaerae bacterium GWF2_44_16]